MQNNNLTCCNSNGYSSGLSKIVRLKLINSIAGIVFLTSGLLFEFCFPEQGQVASIMQFLAALIVSIPIFINAIRGFFSLQNSFMTEQLVSLAVLASMATKDFTVATLIPIILAFGHLLEEKSIMGVEEAIDSLKKLHSKQARLLNESEETLVEPNQLKINDLIVCYPGEIIATDGVVYEGESYINQAPITGESVPIEAFKGVSVYAGTINMSGKLLIKVTTLSQDTLFNKIVMMLYEAEKSKAPIVKLIEKYLDLYFPFVIMLSAISLFLTSDISRAITVLIISCPCALVLASPSAMIAALVVASRRGIMIKNTAFLEILSEIDTLVLDKTGTVTYGRFELETIRLTGDNTEKHLLESALLCAGGSVHPVSVAIRNYAKEQGIIGDLPTIQLEFPGKGVMAKQSDRKVFLGKLDWIKEKSKASFSDIIESGNFTSAWVADEESIIGEIIFSDRPREEIKQTIIECRNHGVKKVYLVTGDKNEIATKVGEHLGLDEVLSECLPQQKLDFVNLKKAEGNKVMFVGDGINDALALKAADVGVAIAKTGSDIAIQNADIALSSDDLSNLSEMFSLSIITRSLINQNIIIGTGFSFFMLLLASLGIITPLMGAITHNLGSFFVILNSSRMLNYPKSN